MARVREAARAGDLDAWTDREVQKAGIVDLAALQKQLMTELREATLNLVDFAHSFFAALWVQHFGKEIDAKDITEATGAPKFDEVSIPFFVEV